MEYKNVTIEGFDNNGETLHTLTTGSQHIRSRRGRRHERGITLC